MNQRFIFSIILLLLIKPVVPLVDYVLHYDYIKNELCAEKENKNSNCNGTCFLKDKLADASENQNSYPESKVTVFNEILFCNSLPNFGFLHFLEKVSIANDNNKSFYFYWNTSSIFHPPVLG